MSAPSPDSLAYFPPLVDCTTTLSPMEKSLLGHFLLLSRPKVILELGVFEAVTTRFICDFVQHNEMDAHVYGFDLPDVIRQLRETDADIQALEAEGRLTLIPGFLPDALNAWCADHPAPIDLALVDAGHTYWHVSQELNILWKHLAPSGYILCDDYAAKHDGVRYAVDVFARRRDVRMLPLLTHETAPLPHYSYLAVLTPRQTRYSLVQHLRYASEFIRRWPVVRPLWNWARRLWR